MRGIDGRRAAEKNYTEAEFVSSITEMYLINFFH